MSKTTFLRKHCSMFTESEVAILRDKIRSCEIHKLTYSPHFFDRKSEYNVQASIMEIHDTIRTGRIVEYKRHIRNLPIERFLIRDHHGRNHTCVVLQNDRGNWRIITAWQNSPNDQHSGVDMAMYTDFDISQCIDIRRR